MGSKLALVESLMTLGATEPWDKHRAEDWGFLVGQLDLGSTLLGQNGASVDQGERKDRH